MLFEKGVNWNDYPASFKRGTFVMREKVLRELSKEELERIPEAHRPDGPVERTDIIIKADFPPFGSITNRAAVLFEGATPELARDSEWVPDSLGEER